MRVGASYYPEVLSPADWERDLATGREIGLSALRCGEFAWAAFSPTATAWEPEWAVRFLDLAQHYGYDVIWCTPSATPPPYLFDRWPDLQAVSVDQRPMPVGIRRHYCPSHAGYRALCAETAGRLAEVLAAHPAVVGWQVDNEIAGDAFTCWCEGCRRAFHPWLRERYGSLAALNAAWQTSVWSQVYTEWAHIPLPHRGWSHAPALRLAYRRFRSENWLAFYRAQADALRAHGARTVTTNFYNYTWDTPFDYVEWRPHLDAMGISHYLEDAEASRFQLALLRGAHPGERPLWVLEQKAGQQRAQNLYPESLSRLEAHLTRCAEAGAEYAIYWHLRQHSAGCEMEHGAVLRHDGTPTRIARAIQQAIARTADLPPTPPASEVLLLASFPQQWAQEMRPPAGSAWQYLPEVQAHWYTAARARWGDIRVGAPQEMDATHAIILAPFLQLREPGVWDRLRQVLHAGGTVITTADFGRVDGENNIVREAPLSLLRQVAPVPDLDILHLDEGVEVPGILGTRPVQGRLFWALPDTTPVAAAIGTLQHDDLGGPVALRFTVGEGTLVVALTALDSAGVTALLSHVFAHKSCSIS